MARLAVGVRIRNVGLAVFFSLCLTGIAQSQADPAAGVLPFSIHSGGNYDSIDPASGNIMFSIPVISRAGKFPFSFRLQGNFHAFVTSLGGYNPPYWWVEDPAYDDQLWGGGGLKGIPFSSSLGSALSYTTTYSDCNGSNSELTDSNFVITDSTGAAHPISRVNPVQYGPCGNSGGGTGAAADGSGYTLIATPANPPIYHVYDRSGNNLDSGFTDPDGVKMAVNTQTVGSGNNMAWVTTYTDTLGTTALTSTIFTDRLSGGSAVPDTYTYTDAKGNPQTVQVNYTPYPHQTNFGCGITEMNQGTVFFPTSVILADGETIGISYEATPGYPGSVTGRLSKISLPTGGYVAFSYSGGSNGMDCTSDMSTITRTTNDGYGHISSWTYAPSHRDNYGNYTVTATDLLGDTVAYHYYEPSYSAYLTETVVTDINLGVLNTTVTCYNGNNSSQSACIAPQNYSAINEPITQTDTYSSVTASSPASLVETKFDGPNSSLTSYGDVISVKKYDFGATYPPSGRALSETDMTYANVGGVNCGISLPYIYDHPCSTTTLNPYGVQVSQTNYSYSATGHPTQIQKWVSGSTFLTSSATYNSNGTTATSTDVNGEATTTYSYNGTGGCNNLLPTSSTVTGPGLPPGGLMSSETWDCNGGEVTSATDPNGRTTNYGYVDQNGKADPLWRMRSVTDPLNNTTWTTYPPGGTLPVTVESAFLFNNNASTVDTLTTFDGLGRTLIKQTRQAPGSSNFDTVSTTYDLVGRVYSVSIPCVAVASQPCPSSPATTTTYDALSRPLLVTDGGGGTLSYSYSGQDVLQTAGPAPSGENVKSKQLQYDGIGRLTSVCEITGTGNGGGNCVQANPQTGYRTVYGYDALGDLSSVSQNAQNHGNSQSRSYFYDGLGRVTSETNPENGRAYYTYDSQTKCGNSAGDLVNKTDAMGNVTCFAYDALHRNTAITYPSGPYATHTPPKTFVYDHSSAFSCPTGANQNGRMAEAYTGPSAAKITDLGYCYSPRGETTDAYESTPHSGGYYHVPMTYWADGIVNTFGPFLTQDQQVYTPDGEGRAGSAGGLTPSITYNAASQPTVLQTSCNNGTCYPITYTYDPNTLRMTNYSAGLSGGTISGAMNWNPNGSLQSLAIADPFNAADNQTCTYAADDLSRLAGVNCGSTWAQTFNYDPFGNLTKSGSISWMPGYNLLTNHYTLGGASYDADGDVLNDTFNSYTWDADGKNLSTSYYSSGGETFSFINDAFGHHAEMLVNGAYGVSYLTLGKFKLSAQGQSPFYSEYPLPGGSVLSQGGGSHAVQMADWLGTIRAMWLYTGGSYIQSNAHAPFGESYSYNCCYPLGFAGEGMGDGDMTNTTYWFPERHLRSSQGRWLSPDPAGMGAANPANPQSWNRYAYVLNNPMVATDPTGLGCVYAWTGDQTYGQVADCFNQSYCDPMDASCDTPSTPSQDPAGDANSFFNRSIAQNTAQAEAAYTGCVAFNFNCDANGKPLAGPGENIWVNCTGMSWDITCQPPAQTVDGSLAWRYRGDPPIGMNFINCAGCGTIWRNAPSFVGVVYGASVVAEVVGFVAADYAAGPGGSTLFGNPYNMGSPGILNSSYIRMGFSYEEAKDIIWFSLRIGSQHMDLWPW